VEQQHEKDGNGPQTIDGRQVTHGPAPLVAFAAHPSIAQRARSPQGSDDPVARQRHKPAIESGRAG
jgi:hypothetical protein